MARSNRGAEAAADHAQKRIDMGARRVPNSLRVMVDAVGGGTRMRPKFVLYMLNMLHTWSWETDTQPSENAVG